MATRNTENTALVLSGGGAKGAFQAGALQVLRDRGYRFDVVSGVSVGTLNGAMVAAGRLDELIEVWKNIGPEQVYRERSLFSIARRYLTYKLGWAGPPLAKFDNDPLRSLMAGQLLGLRTTVPFYFGFVRLETGEYVKATIEKGREEPLNQNDIDRMLASTAIPVVFDPVISRDSVWVDGGLRNISPIADILPHNPSRLILIPTEPISGDPGREEVKDILQIAFRSINTMLDEIFREDIDRFLSINRLVKQAEQQNVRLHKADGSPYRYIEPIIIAPEEPLGHALDFDNRQVREMMQKGREIAENVLNSNQ